MQVYIYTADGLKFRKSQPVTNEMIESYNKILQHEGWAAVPQLTGKVTDDKKNTDAIVELEFEEKFDIGFQILSSM